MPPLTVKAFLDTLKRRFEDLPPEGLQAAVLRLARTVEPSERRAFLEAFAPPRARRKKMAPDTAGKRALEEIRAFRKRLEAGDYADGWGWDDDFHDERLFGDESWADEAGIFLAEAREFFEEGRFDLSRDVYREVFKAIEAGMDDALLPGEDPVELLGEDLEEQVCRFLRSAYRTSEPADRPGALLEGFRTVWGLVPRARLEGVLEVSAEELPGLETFGAAWISFLGGSAAGSPESRLLQEAVRLFWGAEGLAELARSRGRKDPEAYVAWVVYLRGGGSPREAADAAREALEALSPDLSVRTRLADLLRDAAGELGDTEAVDWARHEAFRAGPTLTRLLCWLEDDADHAERDRRLSEALARIEEIEAWRAPVRTPQEWQEMGLRPMAEPGLHRYVQLLRGEYEAVASAMEEAEPLGWSSSDHPGPLAVPFFLAAACEAETGRKLGPRLAELWRGVAEVPTIHFGVLHDADEPARPLGDHLEEVLRRFPLDGDSRERFFRMAEETALARVHAIVSGKHRRSYGHAARLLLAVADAHHCLGRGVEAGRVVAEVKERYRRHRAFHAELQMAAKLT